MSKYISYQCSHSFAFHFHPFIFLVSLDAMHRATIITCWYSYLFRLILGLKTRLFETFESLDTTKKKNAIPRLWCLLWSFFFLCLSGDTIWLIKGTNLIFVFWFLSEIVHIINFRDIEIDSRRNKLMVMRLQPLDYLIIFPIRMVLLGCISTHHIV